MNAHGLASDAALIIAISRYEDAALAEVYRRHAGAVFSLSSRLIRNRQMAEDVTQEVFLRLWHEPHRYDPERGSLRSLLLSWTHGRSIDMLRSVTARERREVTDARNTATRGYDIEDEAIDLLVAEQVHSALDDLKPEERLPIEMAYFGGLSYREVARQLDEPEGTVKSRIRSGLKSLRASLVRTTEERAR